MKFNEKLSEAMEHFSTRGGFLTVKGNGIENTMTISWGFVGFIWNKPHFIVVVRPQRYTRQAIDGADSFTVSVPFGNLKQELGICGTKSGADIDKKQVVTFKPARSVSSPVIDGCSVYYECKISYRDAFDEGLLPDFIKESFYKDDYHLIFFGEIVDCYEGGDA